MSVQVGPPEDIPIVWQVTGFMCSICGTDQFNGFKGEEFIGVCCPNGHWNVLGIPKNTVAASTSVETYNTTLEESPPEIPQVWIKPINPEQEDQFNKLQEASEKITNQMRKEYEKREEYRQAIANMTCPFTLGMCIETGTGNGPKDKRVVTKISGGNTLNGEYWRAWGRTLKKDGSLGDKPYRIKPNEKGFRLKGTYNSVEGLPVEVIDEDMII